MSLHLPAVMDGSGRPMSTPSSLVIIFAVRHVSMIDKHNAAAKAILKLNLYCRVSLWPENFHIKACCSSRQRLSFECTSDLSTLFSNLP